jgi:hypothetical protein
MGDTSGTSFDVFGTLSGKKSSPKKTMKQWPGPMAAAYFCANSIVGAFVPDQRKRHFPDDSQGTSISVAWRFFWPSTGWLTVMTSELD